jgi:four helix bundle protein
VKWQDAIVLAEGIHRLTRTPALRMYRPLRDQLEPAALSLSNNIAEGFERGTTNELLSFLYIARGSAGEIQSTLCLLERFPEAANLKSEMSDLKSNAESVSRQLRGWDESLQNSPMKGPRHLTEKEQVLWKRRRGEFLRQLRAVGKGGPT